ncbi:TonB-dependent receptor [Sphingomonas cannabina]|uniref:TonB-dependent receptor n=1 Tax=Sphingomonas cannabina TaxID=2899123 RepID=UPI001F2ECB17|nr:TonB-dependent receptor [Sphingomonas cannabina]UIJ44663.1 TonB-dependent receptor [Sphingomonas cannabina]
MKSLTLLRMSTALPVFALASISPMALAQVASDSSDQTATLPSDQEGNASDILVIGVRGSVEAASTKKKNAKQIVDSVVAEDAGKLPDNNVPEALSRVTGVQIDRERGQGQSVTIRGLSQVQTTINGNNTNLGTERSLNLADIPAELLKSVEVYKTRTADQVEGGVAGTVNVELRRPLDLKKGWTIAGSARGAYDEFAKKVSPYGSLLVGDRFETGIGELGFLVNGSWTKTFYRENYVESESPDTVCCEADPNSPLYNLPANLRNIVIPYRTQYGLESGHVTRPSVNVVLQWKPSDKLEFVLEGGYLGSREKRSIDKMWTLNREWNTQFSGIELMPDGQTISKLTIADPNGVRAYIEGTYNSLESNLYTTNFEANWKGDRAQLHFGAQYNWSNDSYYFVQQILRPQNLASATIDFVSNNYSRPIPSITLNGVDLDDVSVYGVDRFQDNAGDSKNKEFATQADLTLTLSNDSFLRSLQAGVRYNRRKVDRYYGYRDGFPRVNGVAAPLTALPGGDQAAMIGPDLDGSPQWYRIPGPVLLANITAVREYIQVTDPGNAERFASELPPSDQGQTFRSTENTFAAYAQLNYGLDVGFPIDGVIGLRAVNTWGVSNSFNYRISPAPENALIIEQATGRGNFMDYLPSVTSTLHFDSKTQLRLSYTTNVSRPSFYDLRPFYFVDPNAANPRVDAGNPDLKAQKEWAIDGSLEHYFGRAGSASLAGYYKKVTNWTYYSAEIVDDLAAYGLPGRSGTVAQQRNAGDGEFIGAEAAVQSFFDFLPGFWKNFGASLNVTRIIRARVEYPYPEDFPGAFDSVDTSKWTANAALYYDTPKFSTRVAFNYRSPYRLWVWTDNPEYSWYNDDTYRLDAAINYTPVKFMTFSLEGTNLLGNDVYRYFGQQNLLPLGVRTLARTVQGSVRFRF